jgi:hypothetical protein
MGFQPDMQGEIDTLGSELSVKTGCSIRYCADLWNKPMFQCNCGATWPLFALQGAHESRDWSHIIERHNEVKHG